MISIWAVWTLRYWHNVFHINLKNNSKVKSRFKKQHIVVKKIYVVVTLKTGRQKKSFLNRDLFALVKCIQ